ncbi:MAG: hypothetical protein J7J31_07350 [Helicobacteraceae bacterium]|nr:hypothetical protein [Helicobacteraceae bacterium]
MALFSNSILKNYKQDEGLIALRWTDFQSYIAKLKIDQIIYKLYDLTDDEIKIVEGV